MWSNGGNLTLGGGYAYFGGTIRAAGGAPSAAGGTLTMTVGTNSGSIVVAQSGSDLAAAFAGQPTPVSFTALIARLLSTPGVQTTTSATSNPVVPVGLVNFVLSKSAIRRTDAGWRIRHVTAWTPTAIR